MGPILAADHKRLQEGLSTIFKRTKVPKIGQPGRAIAWPGCLAWSETTPILLLSLRSNRGRPWGAELVGSKLRGIAPGRRFLLRRYRELASGTRTWERYDCRRRPNRAGTGGLFPVPGGGRCGDNGRRR